MTSTNKDGDVQPACLWRLVRLLRERKLDKTEEKIAALEAKIGYWAGKTNIKTGGIPDWLCDNLASWNANVAALKVRKATLISRLGKPNN